MSDINVMSTQGVGVNEPSSGTYGEEAALHRLEAALPIQDAPSPAEQASPPGGMGGEGAGVQPGPPLEFSGRGENGLPGGVFAPTRRPDQPMISQRPPAPVNPVAEAPTEAARRLAMLDQLARSNEVSTATKQWAQTFLEKLASRGRQ